jgi:hypothetical protein
VLPPETGPRASGTGAFAGARGSIEGGGIITFTATGVDAQLVYVVTTKDQGNHDGDFHSESR